MFSKVITIFNQYEDSAGSISWYPHIIPGVHLELNKGQLIKKYGPECADSAEAFVAYKLSGEEKYITDASGSALLWLPEKQWKSQDVSSLAESITFGGNDFFWLGTWEGADPVKDADYSDRLSEGFFAYMNRNEDFAFRITSVGIYALIPHFEILAK